MLTSRSSALTRLSTLTLTVDVKSTRKDMQSDKGQRLLILTHLGRVTHICVTSRVRVKNDQHLSWGVYGVYSSIKIALKRYKDILQIQIKYNKMHSHSTLPTRSFIHSFTRSFIHSLIHSHNTAHHSCITHASPIHHTLHHTMHHPFIPMHHTMHHPFVTLHLNTSYQ